MWDWIGFGAHRVKLPRNASPEERVERSKAMLARVLELGTVVAFVGSGLSKAIGYPSWNEMAAAVVDLTLETLGGQKKRLRSFEIERLDRFRDILKSGAVLDGEQLMSYVTICQRALKNVKGKDEEFHRYIKAAFGPRPETSVPEHPYDVLADLPIKRFATTNYDCEIERALIRKRNILPELFGIAELSSRAVDVPSGKRLSFTQSPDYCNQMAIFPFAWADSDLPMVFHCHGRFDEPESIIASELEYQEWYLGRRRGEGPTFRQSIELLLSSNPLLFVGYGLNDEDLLRSLRQLRANHRYDERPLFALIPHRQPADVDRQVYFYDRYGLHVIPFDAPTEAEVGNWALSYCRAFRNLESHWQTLRRRWIEKPVFLQAVVGVRPPKAYRYPIIKDPARFSLKPKRRFAEMQRKIREIMGAKVRVIVLLGVSGSGKTAHAVEVFEDLVSEREFDGYFFWDANFSDDALTGREYLLKYLDPDHELDGTYIERIRKRLQSKRYLLVIDGVERLLYQGEHPEKGKAANPAFATALGIFASEESQSTVILASALWPLDLGSVDSDSNIVKSLKIPPIRAEELMSCTPFDKMEHAQVSALCGLLDGHSYGLLLACKILSCCLQTTISQKLDILLRKLGKVIPAKRLNTMIEIAIGAVCEPRSSFVRLFLQHLAAFVSPIGPGAFEMCYDLTCKAQKIPEDQEHPPLNDLRDQLLATCLLLAMDVHRHDEKTSYALHPLIRSHLQGSHKLLENHGLPDFSFNGLVTDSTKSDLGSRESFKIATVLFNELERRVRSALARGDQDYARRLLRRLFSLMRARLSAFDTSSWASYDRFASFAYRMLALVKRASPRCWAYCSSEDLQSVVDPAGVLYPGDLAWLYNELGLVLEAEGLAEDAEAIWGQGYEINRLIESAGDTDGLGEYVLRSFLNLLHLSIDRAQYRQAEEYLRQAESLNRAIGSHGIAGNLLGFQGMLEFFKGDLEKADSLYAEARDKLERSSNQRGLIFFLAHHALLKHKQGRADEMAPLVAKSQALVVKDEYRHLAFYVDIAKAQQEEYAGKLGEARALYESVRSNAQTKRDRKIECIVLSDLSRIAEKQGDAEGARRLAIEGLGIANIIGLQSRLFRLLRALALATQSSGNHDLAIAYFKLVEKLATEAGNLHTRNEAREKLRELGEAPKSERSLF